jgi:DNA polymerase elongation subunit (family B)
MEIEMDTRPIIDYAQDDNGVEFRNALYASIHDRVAAHIEAKKQELAHNLISPQVEVEQEQEEEQQETEIENT